MIVEQRLLDWTANLQFAPDLVGFLHFLETEAPPLDMIDSVFRSEGLSGKHASSFFVRFLKRDDLLETASSIVQLLTPVDVLCGSAVTRKLNLEIENFSITILTGNQETVGLGFKVWPAAEFAIRRMIENFWSIGNRRVVELGAGLGVCGIFRSQIFPGKRNYCY